MRKLIILGCLIFLLATPVLAQETFVLSGVDSPSVQETLAILTQAYSKLGISVEFVNLPHVRSLENSNSGKTDGEVQRIKGIEKRFPNLVMVPITVEKIEGVAFTKGKVIPIDGWDSLKGYRVGVIRGVKFTEAGAKDLDPNIVKEPEQLMKMVDAGRIDVAVLARSDGEKALKNTKYTGIEAMEPPVQTVHLYHYLNKKHEALVPEITKALEEVTKK